jgi:SNF2 family DNA or RNA helicase
MSDLLTRDLLHGYQERAIRFIHDSLDNHTANGCALWLDMGLGKSVITATAASEMLSEFKRGRMLVVAPKRVALTTWPIELSSWEQLLHLRHEVIHGNAKERTAAIMRRADIHIISRDNLAWLVRMVGKQWPWDLVILDESSSFKNPTSNRFKALKKALGRISTVVELSATPSPQGLIDIWSQFYLIDRGHRLGATQKAYHTRWFHVDREKHLIIPKAHADEEIHDLISDVTVHMNADDYLDMPELIVNQVQVDLPASARRDYERFEKDMLIQMESLEIEGLLDEEEVKKVEDIEIEASNAATLTGKLLQFANGAIYTDAAGSWVKVHDEKIEAIKEVVEALSGYPVLVAYNFKSDLARLKKTFPFAKVMDDDPETQHRWNRGELPMMLVHPASAGHGLNLQKGSNVIIWFGLNWSLELYQQLLGRLYRQGQTKDSVIVHHIAARDTVDERVMSVLKHKGATQKSLLDAVRKKY